MLSACRRCEWVMNKPTKEKEVEELITGAAMHLYPKNERKAKNFIKKAVTAVLSNQTFKDYLKKRVRICRYCMWEEACTEIKEEEVQQKCKDTFMKAYDFGTSVIY